jgi:ubiquinone/menaquinone biosynthesis C-methylase UbiE
MARINYDEHTAAAYKAVREVPRDGLREWREAVRRHLQPSPGMTVVDIGAGTGLFTAAFSHWFGLSVVAVEPSAPMRQQIPRTPAVQVLAGHAGALPLPDESVDAAWLSLVIHHIPDLAGAAHEIRRVLRPGAPVLMRQGFPDRYAPAGTLRLDTVELIRWFPETAKAIETFPSLTNTCKAFAAAGFHLDALEQVRETYPTSLADFLGQVDTFRHADTTMRTLTEDEFARGKERLRRAVRHAEDTANPEPRSNWLDLLVLRRPVRQRSAPERGAAVALSPSGRTCPPSALRGSPASAMPPAPSAPCPAASGWCSTRAR